jgi:hypothetical protein
MKYYIGYFNEPWDKSKFTVICECPRKYAAEFILSQYKEHALSETCDVYEMLSVVELTGKELVF